jgi:hypothetical protein
MERVSAWRRRVALGVLLAGSLVLSAGLAGCQGMGGGGGQITPQTDPKGPAMQAQYQKMMEDAKNKKPNPAAPVTAPTAAPTTGSNAPPGPK